VRDHDESTCKEEDVNDDFHNRADSSIFIGHLAWRLPTNVNIEEGESK
jgi:hypothetical protein